MENNFLPFPMITMYGNHSNINFYSNNSRNVKIRVFGKYTRQPETVAAA